MHFSKLLKAKDKQKNVKISNAKTLSFKIAAIILIANFTTETQGSRRQENIFKLLEISSCQTRILHPVKISLKIENGIIAFPGKQKGKSFVTSRPALMDILIMKFRQ